MGRYILYVVAFADFKVDVGHRFVVVHEAESLLDGGFRRLPVVMRDVIHYARADSASGSTGADFLQSGADRSRRHSTSLRRLLLLRLWLMTWLLLLLLLLL